MKRIKKLDKHLLRAHHDTFNLDIKNYFTGLDIDFDDVDKQYYHIKTSIGKASSKIKPEKKEIKINLPNQP